MRVAARRRATASGGAGGRPRRARGRRRGRPQGRAIEGHDARRLERDEGRGRAVGRDERRPADDVARLDGQDRDHAAPGDVQADRQPAVDDDAELDRSALSDDDRAGLGRPDAGRAPRGGRSSGRRGSPRTTSREGSSRAPSARRCALSGEGLVIGASAGAVGTASPVRWLRSIKPPNRRRRTVPAWPRQVAGPAGRDRAIRHCRSGRARPLPRAAGWTQPRVEGVPLP